MNQIVYYQKTRGLTLTTFNFHQCQVKQLTALTPKAAAKSRYPGPQSVNSGSSAVKTYI